MSRRAPRLALWLLVMLLAGEGAVRLAGHVLRRDQDRGGVGDTIFCVGDSFTYGQGVARDEAWPARLAGLLQAELGARAPRVQIMAEPGRSSSVALVEVGRALASGKARLILVLTGWNANDGDFSAYAREHARSVPWTTTVDVWLESSRLYRVVKQAFTYRGRTLVLGDLRVIPQTTAMSLYDFRAYQEIARDNLRRIARLCRTARVPCALLTYPHQDLPPNPYTRTEYYHALFGRTPLSEEDYLVHDRRPHEIAIDAVIRSVSESEELPRIDLQPAFEPAAGRGLFQEDWHHPTAAGHAVIAATVLDAIRGPLHQRAPR